MMSDRDAIVLGRINPNVSIETQLRALAMVMYDLGEFGTDIATIAAKGADEIARLSAENERLRALLSEVASDLAEELHGRYDGTLQYPGQKRRYERDMDSVYRARATLQEQDDG